MNDLETRIKKTAARRRGYRLAVGYAAAHWKESSRWCVFALKLQESNISIRGKINVNDILNDAWATARHCARIAKESDGIV